MCSMELLFSGMKTTTSESDVWMKKGAGIAPFFMEHE